MSANYLIKNLTFYDKIPTSIYEEFTISTQVPPFLCAVNGTTNDHHTTPEEVEVVRFVAYGVLLPILVTFGILGDVLNLIVLSRPNMTGVAYVYMRGYAASSLFALLCAIPFTHRVFNHEFGKWSNYCVAFYHAHIELFLGNSCITIGVLMLLALTVERFISVCYPAQARNLCDTHRAYVTVGVIPITTLVLYAPNCFISQIHSCIDTKGHLIYRKHPNNILIKTIWFMPYKFALEVLFKLFPAIILVFLNIRIIRSYRAVCRKRRQMTNHTNQYAEESRLMFLLGGTSTLFFVCMTPMIVLSVTFHWVKNPSIPYEIFRATANLLEVTNFAVTFYIYCLFSKDFRETFFKTLKTAKAKSLPPSFFGSVSGLKDVLKPPLGYAHGRTSPTVITPTAV